MVSTKSEPKMRVGRAKPLVESRDKTPVGSQEADAGGFPSVGRPERTLNFFVVSLALCVDRWQITPAS